MAKECRDLALKRHLCNAIMKQNSPCKSSNKGYQRQLSQKNFPERYVLHHNFIVFLQNRRMKREFEMTSKDLRFEQLLRYSPQVLRTTKFYVHSNYFLQLRLRNDACPQDISRIR